MTFRFQRSINPFALGMLLLSSALAGCKTQVSIPAYMADIVEVADTGNPIDIEMQIRVPVPSAERCEEYTPRVMPILERGFRKVTAVGCGQDGYDDYLAFKVSSAVVRSEEGTADATGLPDAIAVAVHGTKIDGKDVYSVGLVQKYEDMKAIVASAEKEFYQKLSTLQVQVEFQNDSRETVVAEVSDIFVNGEPVVGSSKLEVQRRTSLTLVLSDVAVAGFRKGAGVEAVKIEKAAGVSSD